MIRTALLALLVLLAGVSAGQAGYFDLSDPIEGHPGKTYFDLARSIVTDLHMEGDLAVGEVAIPVRHIVDGYGGRPPARIELSGLIAVPFRGEAHLGTLALIDLGWSDDRVEPTAVLALFDERLRLVDAVDVGMDRQVGIQGEPFKISDWNEAVAVYSSHHNSNQSYDQYAVVFFRNGRFQLVDTVSTFGDHNCGQSHHQSIAFSSAPAAEGDDFWPITVTVKDKLEVDLTVTCEDMDYDEPFERSTAVTYRWDDVREAYQPDSDALERLAETSSERY